MQNIKLNICHNVVELAYQEAQHNLKGIWDSCVQFSNKFSFIHQNDISAYIFSTFKIIRPLESFIDSQIYINCNTDNTEYIFCFLQLNFYN